MPSTSTPPHEEGHHQQALRRGAIAAGIVLIGFASLIVGVGFLVLTLMALRRRAPVTVRRAGSGAVPIAG